MRHRHTIWVIDAKTAAPSHLGLHTPSGPHLVLADEPEIGERIVAKLTVSPVDLAMGVAGAWVVTGPNNGASGTVVRLWSRPAHARLLGDDSDAAPERDITADVVREIMTGPSWCTASCTARLWGPTDNGPDVPAVVLRVDRS